MLTTSPAAAAASSLPCMTAVQSVKTRTILVIHCWWKAGTMALLRSFHVSKSAGMRPLPMIGSRISARMPLS